MAEPVGIVGLALPAIASIAKLAELFNKIQNAPKEIRLLNVLLSGIAHDFKYLSRELEANAQNEEMHVRHEVRKEIETLLQECERLLESYYSASSGTSAFRGVRRAFWSVTRGAELDGHRSNIQALYTILISPLWHQLGTNRPHCDHGRANSTQLHTAPVDPVPRHLENAPFSTALLQVTLHNLVSQGRDILDLTREEIEEATRRAASRSVTAADERVIFGADAIRLDAPFTALRATLNLGPMVPESHRILKIDGIQTLDRGEKFTILRLRCHGGSIRVKHLVPSDAVPFTNDKGSLMVTFLATHTITVIDDEGHHVYQIYRPEYKFVKLDARQAFQNFARGRQLVAEFDASDIVEVKKEKIKECLALCQVIQLWSSQSLSYLEPTMTMAFLITTTKQGRPHFYHAEYNVNQFQPKPVLTSAPRSWKLKTVVLHRRSRSESGNSATPDGDLSITFEDEKEAQRFKEKMEDHIDPNGLLPALTFQSGPFSTTLISAKSINSSFIGAQASGR